MLDYHDDNFAIVFAAMGVRGAGQIGKFWQPCLPWTLALSDLMREAQSFSLRSCQSPGLSGGRGKSMTEGGLGD